MNVQTIEMDPRIARIHYLDYSKKVREHREERRKELEKKAAEAGKALGQVRIAKTLLEKEDEELMRSYRAMALGQRIINLASVLVKAGFDPEKKLPILAVAVADWQYCHLRHDSPRLAFTRDKWMSWSYKRSCYTTPAIWFADRSFAPEIWNSHWRNQQKLPEIGQRALVPAIPAHLRPAGDLSGYHILWEAKWEPSAPVDPLLLKHVSGNIYSIVAQWDLTPIEQAVLEGRIA